jgi:hypothetical protein
VAAANQAGQLIERNATLREQLWEQTVTSLRDSQRKLQQEVADARERAAQAEASKWSVETRLVGTLQAHEKAQDQIRELSEKLDLEEAESRRNALDRQRFAAYLEEGLAMLGAIPPGPEHDVPEDDVVDSATLAGVAPPPDLQGPHTLAAAPPPPPDSDEQSRPTASYAAIMADDDDAEITKAPVHDEPEAEPLPEPTRP